MPFLPNKSYSEELSTIVDKHKRGSAEEPALSRKSTTEFAMEAPVSETPMNESNPFFTLSPLYLHYPEFDKIKNTDYVPAFEQGMQEGLAEIDAIAKQAEPPNFDNTFVAMEQSGELLNRVSRVFFALNAADSNDDIKAIQTEMAPRLSAHPDSIHLNERLFARVRRVYDELDTLELDPEAKRLVKEIYQDFVRTGATLNEEKKESIKAINTELASLQTKFNQNVLSEVNAAAVLVNNRRNLEGMPEAAISAAAAANAVKEAADIQAVIDAEGGAFKAASWDWAYYAEKVRQQRYDLDEKQLLPYFDSITC